MKTNYQLILDNTIKDIVKSGRRPKLLLHSCCAPCSSYVLEYLSEFFDITVYYYNPNIFPQEEFDFRSDEQVRLVESMGLGDRVKVVLCEYDSEAFYDSVRGMENLPEGGDRCMECFRLRLGKCAEYGTNNGFDYFTTTLSISPHKNADMLNTAGREAEEKFGIRYLYSDFKKKNGYKRSCEISAEYGLYRQDYCGCVYSKIQSENR